MRHKEQKKLDVKRVSGYVSKKYMQQKITLKNQRHRKRWGRSKSIMTPNILKSLELQTRWSYVSAMAGSIPARSRKYLK